MTYRDLPPSGVSGRHDYSRESALAWITPRWRAVLAQMPERDRAEAIERAIERAIRRPRSYLAAHLERLYGVK